MPVANVSLPLELWQLITTFSAADSSSLTALSLVCWTFYANCRPFLFHSITINGKLEKKAEDLILLLQEQPEVAGYIRSLNFALSRNELEFVFNILEDLASAFQMITKLEDLEISCPQELTDSGWTPWPLLISTFAHLLQLPTLQTLSLLRFGCIPVSVIRNLKNIRSLRMVGSTIDDNDRLSHPGGLDTLTGNDDSNQTPIPLDNLDLHVSCEITNHLLFSGNSDHKPLLDVSQLKTLSFHSFLCWPKLPTQCFSQSLVRLSISFGESTYSLPIKNLGAELVRLCPNLQELDIFLHATSPEINNLLSDLRSELAATKECPELCTLSITIDLPTKIALGPALDAEWRVLDDVLGGDSRHGWASLRHVALMVKRGKSQKNRVSDHIDHVLEALPRLHLPKLTFSNRLQFRFAYSS